jgi:hypothetical protein
MRHFGTAQASHWNRLSNSGLAALAGGAASLYLRGTIAHESHSRETGFLSGEAAVNAVLVGETLKARFPETAPR